MVKTHWWRWDMTKLQGNIITSIKGNAHKIINITNVQNNYTLKRLSD